MAIKTRIIRCGYCRHEVKGVGMQHDGVTYCSRSCRELGIARRSKAFDVVYSPWYVVLAIIIGALMLVWATSPRKSWAQQHHHNYHQDFYQHWKVPGKPNESCCNARIEYPNGAQTGDCEPTRAEVRKGDWYVWVRQKGEWLKVPDEKIVRYPNPNIFESHLCWTPQKGIICFKPADLGG